MKEKAIGVFDSGLGGISTLRALTREMPCETFYYYGDSKNAPYGTKGEEEICALATAAAHRLLDMGIKELVIACNTATSAAAASLRRELDIPVVGIEPAVKPAAQVVGDGIMLILATPATVRQQKLARLIEKYGKNAVALPCPGLMEFVERMEMDSGALDDYLQNLLAPWKEKKIDAAVLGCTHYPFLRGAIERVLPGVALFDGNEGTARQARRLLAQRGLLREEGASKVKFFTSGDGQTEISHMRALFTL